MRSASPQHAMLLGQAGTVLNHVVVYCKRAESLVALEYGPANSMDITENLMASAPAGPVLLKEPEHPEPEHLPMLHIDLEHHSLDLDHVVTVLEFAGSKLYQAMHNNCIAFADFIVRALTGNAVKNAPHIFDCVVGKVPPVDSPMLPLVQMMTQLTWHDITDGSRLMREYVQLHGMDAIKPLENAPSVLKADVEAGTGAPAHGKWSVGQSSPASVSEGDSGSSVSTVDEALNAAVDGKMGGTRFGRKGGVPVIPVRPKNRAMNPAPAPTA